MSETSRTRGASRVVEKGIVLLGLSGLPGWQQSPWLRDLPYGRLLRVASIDSIGPRVLQHMVVSLWTWSGILRNTLATFRLGCLRTLVGLYCGGDLSMCFLLTYHLAPSASAQPVTGDLWNLKAVKPARPPHHLWVLNLCRLLGLLYKKCRL